MSWNLDGTAGCGYLLEFHDRPNGVWRYPDAKHGPFLDREFGRVSSKLSRTMSTKKDRSNVSLAAT
jgi:hypothetical protein